ncbi:MAG: hypothetical protein JSW68_13985 [Burkholderiales bacterium]|nr:MAG: hypothetical protein JSW68_13985 [Burkholderiales bacterium]
MFESVLENPILLPALGGLALLGAGYAWYAVRRRRREENFEDSLIATDAFSANSLFGSTGGQSVDTAAPGLTTQASDSSMTIASTEVDPIAEAEVYIAYGREAQAEEILREALRKQPERHAERLKLMEIYAGRKDVAAFNALAEEMFGQGGASSDEWPKVISLGRRIDPDNPMYGGSGGGGGAAGEDSEDMSSQAPAVASRDAGSAAVAAAAGLAAGAAMAAAGRDEPEVDARSQRAREVAEDEPMPFADTAPLTAASAAQEAEAEDDQAEALDFDLDVDTTVDKAAQRLHGELEHELPAVDDAALDSLTMFEPEFEQSDRAERAAPAAGSAVAEAVREAPAPEAGAAAASMDFQVDLPSLDELGSPAGERAAAAKAEPPELDLSAISLDLGASPKSAEGDGEASADANPRWQEMATKLDLASAYEEIGDKEGARELLDEVMRSGDAAQQARARELMEKIA